MIVASDETFSAAAKQTYITNDARKTAPNSRFRIHPALAFRTQARRRVACPWSAGGAPVALVCRVGKPAAPSGCFTFPASPPAPPESPSPAVLRISGSAAYAVTRRRHLALSGVTVTIVRSLLYPPPRGPHATSLGSAPHYSRRFPARFRRPALRARDVAAQTAGRGKKREYYHVNKGERKATVVTTARRAPAEPLRCAGSSR